MGCSRYKQALKLYEKALCIAKDNYFPVIEIQVLLGMAAIFQEKKEFETAILYHSLVAESMNRVKAKCEFAEAQYQIGLTYQAMGETKKSDESFQEAIRLFSEMEAPKQVERVRRSMEN